MMRTAEIAAWVSITGAEVIGLWVILGAMRDRRGQRKARSGRLRYLRRMAWYRLTRRLPGTCPLPDRYRLSPGDVFGFDGIAGRYREPGQRGDEPQRERRQP